MLTLGIETSGHSGSIALVDQGQILAERELTVTGRRHARTLVPEIGEILRTIGRPIRELAGVAVGIGPGSFTGLRVGVVCAKTLAYALGVPIVGVDTFAGLVQSLPAGFDDVWVFDDALRGDVYRGHYRRQGETWECLVPPGLVTLSSWLRSLADQSVLIGPSVEKFRFEIRKERDCTLLVIRPRACDVAFIGEIRLRRNDVDDFWSLEPKYIRRSAAEEKAESLL